MTSVKQTLLPLLSGAWLAATTVGLLMLADYDSQPGVRARAPQQWPRGVSLTLNPSRPTLLMFLHPRCPCSRACLSELARLAHTERDQLNLLIAFVQPSDVPADWSQSDLWKTAVANKNWQVLIDQNGSLAGQFGAKTSGQVLVYDAQGSLQFDGGITPGRGHAGDSIGHSIVQAIAAGHSPEQPTNCPTFGCPLSAPDSNYSPEASARANASQKLN